MIFDSKGILGMNARQLLYIRPYNPKKAIKLADDKIKTKQFLSARDIPVPRLYGAIKDHEELEKFDFNSLPNSFVIKPNHGFGGEGIIVIGGKKGSKWVTVSGKELSKQDIIDHIQDVLDGRFSISNVGDTAFFEQLITADPILGRYSYKGLPDVRVVVHNLIPVMAMLRLPTKASDGKANLHQGAAIVGIDMAKGITTHIAYKNQIVDSLPDIQEDIRGLKVPYWDEILLIASKTQLITNLGYLAADICIDKQSGPVLLEINARAGLGVQLANLAPLRKRLQRIEGVKVTNPVKGVRIAKDMFGNTVEKEIEQLSGKQVIGLEEEIEVIQKESTIQLLAKVDTGEPRSIIDTEMAEKAGLLENTDDYDDEKSTLKLKFVLDNKRIQTVVDVEKIPSDKYKFIIGNRDLKDFLVDSSIAAEPSQPVDKKTAKTESKVVVSKKINYYQIDQELINIDSKIKLLYHLRPTNLEIEKKKFFKNFKQNPQFEYPDLKFDPLELVEKLNKISTDDSPLGILFEKKKEEIASKIALLEAIDEERFSEISTQLFSKPTKEDIEKCSELLKKWQQPEKTPKADMEAEEAKGEFEQVFASYGLENWQVKIKEEMVSDCIAGKNNRLFIRKGTKFNKERIHSLIVHEIETHILTAENGKHQPYEIFNRGLANYLTTQEGMAMYNVEQQMDIPFYSNYKALAHVIAIDQALKGSFIEVFEKILEFKLPIEQAFRSALKAKRGFSDTSRPGAFTKDYLYYKGYQEVYNFIEEGNKLSELYIGKFDLKDLEEVKKVPGIQTPKILPAWLKD